MAKRIGERLVEAGLCSGEAVEQALQQQKITQQRLGDCLVDLGLIQEAALLRFLAAEFKTRFVTAEKLSKARIPAEVLDKVPVRMAEAQAFLPLALDPDSKLLSIVIAEVQNEALITEIKLITEMNEVVPYVGVKSAILAAIKKHYYGDPTAFAALEQGGVQALRPGTAGSGRGEGDSGLRAAPGTGVGIQLDGGAREGTASKRMPSRVSNPTQLREVLSAVRGTVGENDFVETLNILVGLLEMNRKEFRGHSAQVARQSTQIGRRMGLQPRDISYISIAAYLHDLGKRVDKHFNLLGLHKNPEQKAEAKRYVRAPIKLFETVHLHGGVNAILAHLYEAYDGSGVLGVKGEDIPAGARIIAAVDAFLDLSRSPFNAFGRVFTKEEALGALTEQAGKLFDPLVVDAIGHLTSGDLLKQRVENDGRQIVVADPDEAVRTDLQDSLNKQGLTVHAVLKLDGVIDALLAGEAEVIVVGLAYGVGDLVNLASFVRARPESAAVPIIVIGEPTDPQSRDRLLNVGINAFVATPLNPDDAADQIEKLYSDRKAHGGPGHPVRGSFDEFGAADLVRLLARGRKSGRLSVRNGPHEGFIQIEKGRAIFVAWGGKGGEAQLMPMLALPQAEFTWDCESLLAEMPQFERELEVIAREVEAAPPPAPSAPTA